MAKSDKRAYIKALQSHIEDVRDMSTEFPSNGEISIAYDIETQGFASVYTEAVPVTTDITGGGSNPPEKFPPEFD